MKGEECTSLSRTTNVLPNEFTRIRSTLWHIFALQLTRHLRNFPRLESSKAQLGTESCKFETNTIELTDNYSKKKSFDWAKL